MLKKVLVLFAVAAVPAFSQATETRCGYIANPTPANWWISDADGEWTIGEQGGYQVDDKSYDNLAAATANGSPGYFESTNGRAHGVFCGCITGTFSTEKKVLSIESSQQKPLASCDRDPRLHK